MESRGNKRSNHPKTPNARWSLNINNDTDNDNSNTNNYTNHNNNNNNNTNNTNNDNNNNKLTTTTTTTTTTTIIISGTGSRVKQIRMFTSVLNVQTDHSRQHESFKNRCIRYIHTTCVYMCEHLYIYKHMYIHTQTYKHTSIQTYKHANIQTNKQTNIHTCTDIHAYIHRRIYTDIHTQTYIHIYTLRSSQTDGATALPVGTKRTTWVNIHIYIYIYIHICICMYVCVYIYIYIYIYTSYNTIYHIHATSAPAELGGELHNVSRNHIEPVRGSFCRHGSCTLTEVSRLVPSGYREVAWIQTYLQLFLAGVWVWLSQLK